MAKNIKLNIDELNKAIDRVAKIGGMLVLAGAIVTGGINLIKPEDNKPKPKPEPSPIPSYGTYKSPEIITPDNPLYQTTIQNIFKTTFTYEEVKEKLKRANIKLTDEEIKKYLEQYKNCNICKSDFNERELKGVLNPKYEEYLKMYNSELYEKGLVIDKARTEDYLIVYKIDESGIKTMQEIVLPYVVLTEEEYQASSKIVNETEQGKWIVNPEFSKYVELFNQNRKNAINSKVSVYDPSNDENIELLYPIEANYIEVTQNGETTRIFKWLVPEFGYEPSKSKSKVKIKL